MNLPVVLYVSTPTYANSDAEITALYLQLRPHLGAAMMLVTPGVERAEIAAASWWQAHGLPVFDNPPRKEDGKEKHGKNASYILGKYDPVFGIVAGLDSHTEIFVEKMLRHQIRHTIRYEIPEGGADV